VLRRDVVSANPFVTGAMFALTGVTVVVWNVITVSFRQAVVPEGIFGRVNSVYRMLGWGGMSVGALLGGFLARFFGLTAPFWFAAAVLLAMALVAAPLVNNRTMAGVRGSA
jgi:MFS family permease